MKNNNETFDNRNDEEEDKNKDKECIKNWRSIYMKEYLNQMGIPFGNEMKLFIYSFILLTG